MNKEQDLRQYFDSAQEPQIDVIENIFNNVYDGLHLEKGIGRKTSTTVRNRIVYDISTAIYHATTILDNPRWQNVELLYEWGSKAPKSEYNDFIEATADVNRKNPNGIIRLAPEYIAIIAGYMMGDNDPKLKAYCERIPFQAQIGHESLHINQLILNPKQTRKAIMSGYKLSGNEWRKVDIEQEALYFEEIFKRTSNFFANDIYEAENEVLNLKNK